jgi:hypothetical protein
MKLESRTSTKVLSRLTGRLWYYAGRILRSRYMTQSRVALAYYDLCLAEIPSEVHQDGTGFYLEIAKEATP